jgi:hypothetical protein
LCRGFVHSDVNAALISVLKNLSLGEDLIYVGEDEHIRLVAERLKEYGIEGIKCHPVSVPTTRNTVRKLMTYIRICREVLSLASTAKADLVVFSDVDGPSLIAYKLLSCVRKTPKCIAVIHGVLATIMKRPANSFKHLFWFRRALMWRNDPKLCYLVPGEPIRESLVGKLPSLAPYVIHLDLPCLFADPEEREPFAGGVVRIGCFGVGHSDKGTTLLFEMAERIESLRPGSKVEFVLVGHIVDKRLKGIPFGRVSVPSPNEPMSREEYERTIKNMDYAIFFHRADEYDLRASGTLFDAFSHVKPLIALSTPLFEYYVRRFGDIGYLCRDLDQMRDKILEILETLPVDDYNRQRQNILRGRKSMSKAELGRQLADALRGRDWI